MDFSKFTNNLKRYRHIAGYSQKEVALILGFSYTATISKWEKGFLLPDTRYLFLLCHLYTTTPQELYDNLWQSLMEEIDVQKYKVLPKKSVESATHFYL
jgi:transcriptional regulator with XRE-family HTH domain